jgi:hypothetical protein
MINIKIHDLKSFENFLGVASRFVQQGQLIVKKEYSSLYCKNTKDFSSSRLLLDTNTLTLDQNEKIDELKICLRDIPAFRSSINIIQVVEQINEVTLFVEELPDPDGIFAKYIQYKGKTKFKLISVDFQVIEQFVSKAITATEIPETWKFNIDPARLDIIQNRTGTIVNVKDDVSVYFYKELNKETNENMVIIDLNAKNSTYINHIALPVAESSIGSLPEGLSEAAIHESAFRILNILRVTNKEDLTCFFSEKFNVFFINSKLADADNKFWIKSQLLIQTIKGK